jgi:aerobic carbon-monoxide dehydrogenase large subunit
MDGGVENTRPKIGDPVLRKEDRRLLTGGGSFSDDANLPGQTYAAIVRSPHAHARITGYDLSAAQNLPGVIAVLTGANAMADGLKPIPHNTMASSPPDIDLGNSDGSSHFNSPHFILPADKARFVGEALAIVIGDSIEAAKNAAEAVLIDFEILPAVTDGAAALAPGAPLVWEEAGSNLCVDADVGDRAATDAAFAKAAHVVRFDTWVQRVTGVPMEPRAAVGEFDTATGRYTIHAGSGGAFRQKREISVILDVEIDNVRVIAKDVGGNFGTRNSFYPEFAMVAWAAKRIGRPVKWTSDRTEAFLSDHQGRDLRVEAELALDAEGKFIGFRGSNISNVGAHTVSFVPLAKGVEIMSGTYRIPACFVRARAAMTNTASTSPYRSAGRPEVNFVIERLVDLASRQTGIEPVELRRRNLIPANAMPYANGLGMTYDSGDYRKALDEALALGDVDGFKARKAESAQRGKRRGLGIASYMETSTGAPRERTEMTVVPPARDENGKGRIDVVIGTLSSGQGHETSFAQLVTEWLDVDFDQVRLIQGDTDIVKFGGGSHSGRSMRLAGIIMGAATDEIIEKGKKIAGHLLEAAETDINFTDGAFTITGTDRRVGLFEVAAAAETHDDLPDDLKGPLGAESDQVIQIPAFPYGAHVCEVEVDEDTGAIELVKYAGIDDVGRAINPLILHGQAHGAIVQGLGQAMFEHSHYDGATGQLLAASFMDYAMPRADTMPSFDTEISEVPSTTNKLGIRAGGEGGTTPALAVLINAIVDALADLGVRHVEMPATPERVWQAIQQARERDNA